MIGPDGGPPDGLARFLEVEAGGAFDWGGRDCWLLPADWIRCRHGRDPAAAWRGRYRTALGAARLIRRGGGPVEFADASLAACGWIRSRRVRRGQVGLIPAVIHGPRGACADLIGAIALGGGWWAARPIGAGLMLGPAVPVAAWRPK
tara:strand:- start:16800 stop:17240 length:441 start_codon:yes stop_codon:yes gene_type:complete